MFILKNLVGALCNSRVTCNAICIHIYLINFAGDILVRVFFVLFIRIRGNFIHYHCTTTPSSIHVSYYRTFRIAYKQALRKYVTIPFLSYLSKRKHHAMAPARGCQVYNIVQLYLLIKYIIVNPTYYICKKLYTMPAVNSYDNKI